jgi:hypothetical protein
VESISVTSAGAKWKYDVTFVQRTPDENTSSVEQVSTHEVTVNKTTTDELQRMDEVPLEFYLQEGNLHIYEFASEFIGEYRRQLKQQEERMNKLTVEEYLQNVDAYVYSGPKAKKEVLRVSGNWQSRMRSHMKKHFKVYYTKTGDTPEEAERKATEQIQGLAVLHQPDKYAGGAPEQADLEQLFAFMDELDGDSPDYDAIGQKLQAAKLEWFGTDFVNSEIGGSWKDNIGALDQAAKRVPEAERATTLLNVRLILNEE